MTDIKPETKIEPTPTKETLPLVDKRTINIKYLELNRKGLKADLLPLTSKHLGWFQNLSAEDQKKYSECYDTVHYNLRNIHRDCAYWVVGTQDKIEPRCCRGRYDDDQKNQEHNDKAHVFWGRTRVVLNNHLPDDKCSAVEFGIDGRTINWGDFTAIMKARFDMPATEHERKAVELQIEDTPGILQARPEKFETFGDCLYPKVELGSLSSIVDLGFDQEGVHVVKLNLGIF
jgi:hypothetical protein